MRSWVVVVLVTGAAACAQPKAPCVCAPPHASSRVKVFQDEIVARGAAEGLEVVEWWAGNLDDDPAEELVAHLCPRHVDPYGLDDGHTTWFVIDDPGSARWVIMHAGGGWVTYCPERTTHALPPWETRSDAAIPLVDKERGGPETSVPVRIIEGVPEIVEPTHDGLVAFTHVGRPLGDTMPIRQR